MRMVLLALPTKFLLNWWVHRPNDVLVANEALVVERLLNEQPSLKDDILKTLNNRLKEYQQIPGVPLLIYLELGKPELSTVPTLMRAALEDESISDADIVGLFIQYRENLRDFEFAASHVSQSRIALIKRAMK